MSLPKIDTPKFNETFPNGVSYTYRPFKSKEQKNILIAAEGGSEYDVLTSIINLVDVCTFNKIDWMNQPVVNLEHAFLYIRAKSIGEVIDVNWSCQHQEDDHVCNHENSISFDVRDAKIVDSLSNVIKVTDDISIVMETIKVGMLLDFLKSNPSVMTQIKKMTKMIVNGDETFTEFTEEELEEFIDSFPPMASEALNKFISNQPTLELNEDVICSKCGKTSLVNIKGVLNFFG